MLGRLKGSCSCKSREGCWHRGCSVLVLSSGKLLLDNGVHVRLADESEVILRQESVVDGPERRDG
jgi:hypothetical protein